MLVKKMLLGCVVVAGLFYLTANSNALGVGSSPIFKKGEGLISTVNSVYSGVTDNFFGCPVGDCTHIVISEVYFGFDKSQLTTFARKTLDQTVDCIISTYKNGQEVEIMVEGHTDARGSQDYNMNLSKKRATVAREYMVAELDTKVDDLTLLDKIKKNIKTEYKGEKDPVTLETTEEAYAKNRRVEVSFNS